MGYTKDWKSFFSCDIFIKGQNIQARVIEDSGKNQEHLGQELGTICAIIRDNLGENQERFRQERGTIWATIEEIQSRDCFKTFAIF